MNYITVLDITKKRKWLYLLCSRPHLIYVFDNWLHWFLWLSYCIIFRVFCCRWSLHLESLVSVYLLCTASQEVDVFGWQTRNGVHDFLVAVWIWSGSKAANADSFDFWSFRLKRALNFLWFFVLLQEAFENLIYFIPILLVLAVEHESAALRRWLGFSNLLSLLWWLLLVNTDAQWRYFSFHVTHLLHE